VARAKRDELPGKLAAFKRDIVALSHDSFPAYGLRAYQIPPARAIARSIEMQEGKQFAVVFSRQSGKDEMLAQVLVWLLLRYAETGGTAVIAAPTLRPQGAISRDRLINRMREILPDAVVIRDGHIVELGAASARFLSALPTANVRGQTADLLLVANEAQSIQPAVWDPVFDPMAASTNATTIFMGTPWKRDSLLARQVAHLTEIETETGEQRVWKVPWTVVAELLPKYRERVESRIAQFGERHPTIKTEYWLEELDGEESLFPPHRLAAMQGDHPRQYRADPGATYALLIDVAGEEEAGSDAEAFASDSRRDSTALTVVRIDGPDRNSPAYRVVNRMRWTGTRHAVLCDQLVDLARNVWRAERVVIDATGVGAGLASFLEARLADRRAGRAIPVDKFTFSLKSKSQLGWNFIGLIETGRYKEYRDPAPVGSTERAVTEAFWAELKAVDFAVVTGPGKMMRWGAMRGHDDLVISAALVAQLDGVDLRKRIAVGRRAGEAAKGPPATTGAAKGPPVTTGAAKGPPATAEQLELWAQGGGRRESSTENRTPKT
jgi:hypothetical protein